jgi:hypothetical protein
MEIIVRWTGDIIVWKLYRVAGDKVIRDVTLECDC